MSIDLLASLVRSIQDLRLTAYSQEEGTSSASRRKRMLKAVVNVVERAHALYKRHTFRAVITHSSRIETFGDCHLPRLMPSLRRWATSPAAQRHLPRPCTVLMRMPFRCGQSSHAAAFQAPGTLAHYSSRRMRRDCMSSSSNPCWRHKAKSASTPILLCGWDPST